MINLLAVYSLYDIKANIYNTPFYQANDALAVRMLTDLVLDDRSTISKHPQDFQLFKLGTFDSAAGVFNLEKQPVYLVTANEVPLSIPMSAKI